MSKERGILLLCLAAHGVAVETDALETEGMASGDVVADTKEDCDDADLAANKEHGGDDSRSKDFECADEKDGEIVSDSIPSTDLSEIDQTKSIDSIGIVDKASHEKFKQSEFSGDNKNVSVLHDIDGADDNKETNDNESNESLRTKAPNNDVLQTLQPHEIHGDSDDQDKVHPFDNYDHGSMSGDDDISNKHEDGTRTPEMVSSANNNDDITIVDINDDHEHRDGHENSGDVPFDEWQDDNQTDTDGNSQPVKAEDSVDLGEMNENSSMSPQGSTRQNSISLGGQDASVPDYVFSNARWMVVTGLFCILFGGLSFYTAYAQLLDEKNWRDSLDNYKDYEEERKRAYVNPEYITPCTDSFDSECFEQYCSFTVFFLFGTYFIYDGLLQITSNSSLFRNTAMGKFRISMHRGSTRQSVVHPEGDQQVITQPTDSSLLTAAKKIMKNTWFARVLRKTKMGGPLFWTKTMFMLIIALFLQCLRCFYVEGAYATSAAPQTIAQVTLMAANAICCMIAYYYQNELAFATVNWVSEIGYLLIRLSVNGILSLRATEFVDFLILASTFVFTIEEFHKIKKYIWHGRGSSAAANTSFGSSQKRRRGVLTVSVILAVVVATGIVLGLAVKGWRDVCPDTSGSSETENNFELSGQGFLPPGVFCYLWQFNMFLSPSCSCVSAVFDYTPRLDCSLPVQSVVSHFRDGIQLRVEWDASCPTAVDDLDIISGINQIAYLKMRGLDVSKLGPSFDGLIQLKSLVNLRAVLLENSNIKNIDLEVLNSWQDLEHFRCEPCPQFDSDIFFSSAELPNLFKLQLIGVSTCPKRTDLKWDLDHYECFDRNQPEVCNGLPEWFAQVYLSNSFRTSTICAHFCDEYLSGWKSMDGDKDGLMLLNYYRTILSERGGPLAAEYQSYPDEAFYCLWSRLREALPITQNIYSGSKIEDGLTFFEYAVMDNGGGLCFECEDVHEMISHGAEVFANRTQATAAFTVPPVCEALWQDVVPSQASMFDDYCFTQDGACLEICPTVISFFEINDIDQNGLINENEFVSTSAMAGLANLAPPGIFECFFAISGPECIDKENGVEISKAVSMGFWALGFPPSTCSKC